jgi:hypothetical protein
VEAAKKRLGVVATRLESFQKLASERMHEKKTSGKLWKRKQKWACERKQTRLTKACTK